jgi:hypothetical protein
MSKGNVEIPEDKIKCQQTNSTPNTNKQTRCFAFSMAETKLSLIRRQIHRTSVWHSRIYGRHSGSCILLVVVPENLTLITDVTLKFWLIEHVSIAIILPYFQSLYKYKSLESTLRYAWWSSLKIDRSSLKIDSKPSILRAYHNISTRLKQRETTSNKDTATSAN